ncbi:Hypothetical_protein [Hexamita inflata]|uniref:Hypothetical_protein n=1 Tax=Hexamita inflata TaxID=28002 RepID=A0AA86NPG9_9EUKA|nr:Hypothetical protein HINF_LOCUS10388 [Hexamita inflata]
MESGDNSILTNPKLIADLKLILESSKYHHISKSINVFSVNPKDFLARIVIGGLRQIFWTLHDVYTYNFTEQDVQLIFQLILKIKQLPKEKQMVESLEKQYDLPYVKVGAMILTHNINNYVVVQGQDHFNIDKNKRETGFYSLPKGSVDFNDIENFEQKRNKYKDKPYSEQIQLLCDDEAKFKAIIRVVKQETSLDLSQETIMNLLCFKYIKNKKFPGKPRGEDQVTLFFFNYQIKENDTFKAQSDYDIQTVKLYNFNTNFNIKTFGKLSVWCQQLQNIRNIVEQIIQLEKQYNNRIQNTVQLNPQYQNQQQIYDQQILYYQQQMQMYQMQIQQQQQYLQQYQYSQQYYSQFQNAQYQQNQQNNINQIQQPRK